MRDIYYINITSPMFHNLDALTRWVNTYLKDMDNTIGIDLFKNGDKIGYYQDAIFGLLPVKRENDEEVIIDEI